MRPSYTCTRCLSALKGSRTQLRSAQAFRPIAQNVASQRNHSNKTPAQPKLTSPRRALSTTPNRSFNKPFEPYEYIDPEGHKRTLVLTEDNLFNSFTDSPIPQIRKRAAFMRQHAYCPHPDHKPTRAPKNPMDLEARKSSEKGSPPAHVDFECPDCGIPVYCCEEHWADDYEAHLEVCDVLRQSNEDDHDLRSGRFFKEFQFAEPQMEEILVNMTSWDTYLYTRDFDALNKDREMRQATKLLTYPMTIASVINELSPYNIRKGGRMTPEGLKSFSGRLHLTYGALSKLTLSSSATHPPSPTNWWRRHLEERPYCSSLGPPIHPRCPCRVVSATRDLDAARLPFPPRPILPTLHWP
jgi:splicing suppressor protein 51